ncbi:hypothetical protein [Fictibacillus norfolkensis]|uniref:Uncharacterized protein n=1 Tax=Fictibacillus norfolkensis TaxID=2762233 RepID=A0ABR8SJG0_9BACL|nr:hypothetical protein [Fictibacillus norfolkensis]MBD7963621.1 hypothetical protein [Fictibacillus norfolkensis]
MKKASEKRLNAFLILTGSLFLYSIFSKVYHLDSIINDIVYASGFTIAIVIHHYYRMNIKSEKVDS